MQRQRRSIRLKGYDYAQSGAYYVTLCAHQRKCLFGNIVDGEMRPNEVGRIVKDQWFQLTDRFPNISLGEFAIMPNHLHAILWILDLKCVGAGLASARDGNDLVPTDGHPRGAPLRNFMLGEIIGAYKSLVVNQCLKVYKARNMQLGKLWQRNYYEHIIRDEVDYQRISEYIQNNPQRWELDSLYKGEDG